MPDYSKGKIYKIISNKTNDVYIGSTIQSLSVRLAGHRKLYKSYLGGKSNYITSYDILKYDDVKIILIEECPCDNREQLLAREQYHIDNMDCINKNRAIILLSNKEYYKEQYQKALKNNPNLHKDKYQKELKRNPNHNKDNYERQLKNNPNLHKERYEKYKHINNQKILCECGLESSRKHLSRHKTSKIHHDLLSNKIFS